MLKLDRSKLVMNLGKRYKLVPHLEKAIGTFEEEWTYAYKEKQPDQYWHPSSHCLAPASQLLLIANGVEEDRHIGASLRKAFQVGHFWHQWLQYITVEQLGFATWDEIERSFLHAWGEGPFEAITGSADVCPCKPPGWEGVVDFKTTNVRDYAQFAAGRVPNWLAAKYECQMNMYMFGLEQEECLVVPILKDSPHTLCEIVYHRNQPLIDWILDKLHYVSEAKLEGSEITKLEDDRWPEPPLAGPASN